MLTSSQLLRLLGLIIHRLIQDTLYRSIVSSSLGAVH